MAAVILGTGLLVGAAAHAQGPRLDVMWARQAPGAVITLDGVLDEPAWSKADAMLIRYRVDNGIPGSGWQEEGGKLVKDSTRVIMKSLVVGNQLYLGFEVPDSSIGGARDFNRFDGFLMALKDHASLGAPKPPDEYFYSWWYPDSCDANPSAPGKMPDFHGRWGDRPSFCTARTPEMIAAWDAVTKVHGLSNSDAVPDTGYTVEMRMDLGVMGYNAAQVNGDVVEFNVSIYDCDWFWPLNLARFGSNRSWWQSPWGNVMWYSQVQIHTMPSVTINSGPEPIVPPDMVLHASTAPNVNVDGFLTDAAWATADSINLRYDDQVLRDSYPGVMKYRSGQFQPTVNGGTSTVFDPGDATVKWFTKADSLFLGFDVRDQYVQFVDLQDRWDGFVMTIFDRVARWRDHNLQGRRITFHVGPGGTGVAEDYLLSLRDTLGGARFALKLKPNTIPDTTGGGPTGQLDEGYTAEIVIDLTKLGYPHGLGDRILWFGVDLYDGDSFGLPATLAYGTRTWFAAEREHECCPAVVYMQPPAGTAGVPTDVDVGTRFAVLGNQPNPFRSVTMIHYAVDRPSRVSLEVFDLSGRLVTSRSLGQVTERDGQFAFSHPGLHTGLYLVRLKAIDSITGEQRTSAAGKMMFLE
jgi:hypothetical protein